jgi:hypothetical protein
LEPGEVVTKLGCELASWVEGILVEDLVGEASAHLNRECGASVGVLDHDIEDAMVQNPVHRRPQSE